MNDPVREALPGTENEWHAGYFSGTEREARLLDQRIADIRKRADAGTITVRLAADARIDAMQRHLDAVKRLRELYPGTRDGAARASGPDDEPTLADVQLEFPRGSAGEVSPGSATPGAPAGLADNGADVQR